MTERTSSTGVGFSARSGAVRQRVSTSCSISRCSRSVSPIVPSVAPAASYSSSSPARRRIASETARRRASVGCAVTTGWNRIASSRRVAVSAPSSSLSRVNAPGTVSVGACSTGSADRSRSTRTRWCSSTRFTRWK